VIELVGRRSVCRTWLRASLDARNELEDPQSVAATGDAGAVALLGAADAAARVIQRLCDPMYEICLGAG
jgi:hypothetical protein